MSLSIASTSQPVDSTSQGDSAYARIRRDILSCRLMPGALITEPGLMKVCEIGKSSCRSALRSRWGGGHLRGPWLHPHAPGGHHCLGSINNLILFTEGYLELIGLPAGGERLRQEILESPLGIDGLMLASDDPRRTHAALVQAGFLVTRWPMVSPVACWPASASRCWRAPAATPCDLLGAGRRPAP